MNYLREKGIQTEALSAKTKRNYLYIANRYIQWRRDNPEKDVVDYLREGAENKFWSKFYIKMLYKILRPTSIPFSQIQRRIYKSAVALNKADRQSLSLDQVANILSFFYHNNRSIDMFVLCAVLAATGIRFAEAAKLTGENIVDLFTGKTVEIESAKREGLREEIFALPALMTLNLFRSKTVADAVCEWVDAAPQRVFTKSYCSYALRFKNIRERFVKRGSGVFAKKSGTTKGMCLHSFRRFFANHFSEELIGQGTESDRLLATSMAMRHSSPNTTRVYLTGNLDKARTLVDNMKFF